MLGPRTGCDREVALSEEWENPESQGRQEIERSDR